MTDSGRIDRIEVMIEQHDELIDRCVRAMEQEIKIDERLANHLEENKRQWAILDDHSHRLGEMNQQVGEMLSFYAMFRRVSWGVLVFLSAGAAWLIKYWAEHHGVNLPSG